MEQDLRGQLAQMCLNRTIQHISEKIPSATFDNLSVNSYVRHSTTGVLWSMIKMILSQIGIRI